MSIIRNETFKTIIFNLCHYLFCDFDNYCLRYCQAYNFSRQKAFKACYRTNELAKQPEKFAINFFYDRREVINIGDKIHAVYIEDK